MDEKENAKIEEETPLSQAREIYDVKTWLTIHITQLSYIRNLIILLASAEIGFIINNIIKKIAPSCINNYFVCIALILSLLSIAFGLILAIQESKNFRLKRKISRILIKSNDIEKAKIKYLSIEQQCTEIETINKVFFKLQIIFFFLATIFISLIVLIK